MAQPPRSAQAPNGSNALLSVRGVSVRFGGIVALDGGELRKPERLRCFVLVSAWCGLRWGEAIELRRKKGNLVAAARAERMLAELES